MSSDHSDQIQPDLPARTRQLLGAAHAAQLSGDGATVRLGGRTFAAEVELASVDAGRKRDFVRVRLKITLPRDERG